MADAGFCLPSSLAGKWWAGPGRNREPRLPRWSRRPMAWGWCTSTWPRHQRPRPLSRSSGRGPCAPERSLLQERPEIGDIPSDLFGRGQLDAPVLQFAGSLLPRQPSTGPGGAVARGCGDRAPGSTRSSPAPRRVAPACSPRPKAPPRPPSAARRFPGHGVDLLSDQRHQLRDRLVGKDALLDLADDESSPSGRLGTGLGTCSRPRGAVCCRRSRRTDRSGPLADIRLAAHAAPQQPLSRNVLPTVAGRCTAGARSRAPAGPGRTALWR